jgi:hypothetical protein
MVGIAYQGVFVPSDTFRLVGIRIGEASDLTSLAAEDTMQLRANLVAFASLQSMTLCASGLWRLSVKSGPKGKANCRK